MYSLNLSKQVLQQTRYHSRTIFDLVQNKPITVSNHVKTMSLNISGIILEDRKQYWTLSTTIYLDQKFKCHFFGEYHVRLHGPTNSIHHSKLLRATISFLLLTIHLKRESAYSHYLNLTSKPWCSERCMYISCLTFPHITYQ